MNIMPFSEITEASFPLAELSKSHEVLPNRELNKSLGKQMNGVVSDEGKEINKPKRITCINERYSGENHPETGVPYVEKTVKDTDGNEVSVYFLNSIVNLMPSFRKVCFRNQIQSSFQKLIDN